VTKKPSNELKLPGETEKRLLSSIKRYFRENLDQDIGDLKAGLLLDFCLKEIGPVVYNKAIDDAQAWMQERVSDLDGTCYLPDLDFWETRKD